ncbi:Peptidase M50B-like [[Clostridium] polysaccharolyticum]|uniref:Peptidase M50B-like n=1 Tax=[Clostridium] polysaccharolyticum TaxID=29364 RepID=A0A1I0AF69_9FIRM|nr:Peptidase M50B-like [[Clostridium] polysaccharolyticum]
MALLIGFGFVFSFLVKSGWNNLGTKFGTYAFLPRFIGTPVHELGHLIFAALTGSKIHRIRLFPKISSRLRRSGGGYVEFTPRNGLLGSISRFFSGIGPMVFCPFVIMLLMYVLMPDLFSAMYMVFQKPEILSTDTILRTIGNIIQEFLSAFHFQMLEKWQFYVFLFLAVPIANECILSSEDVKNAGSGFLAMALVLAAGGYILSFFPSAALAVIHGLAKTSSLLICVLCFSLVFNLIHWILGHIVRYLL